MSNVVYVGASLDGFIASEDGGLDWLTVPNPDQSDYGYSAFMSGIDALVMGRKTFEKVLTFGSWPYDKPVFVLSNTLAGVPTEFADKAEVINGTLESIVSRLKARGYQSLYIDGGVTVQAFLREDLIDDLIVTQVPVLLGSGIPLFGPLQGPLRFSLEATETFAGGLVKSHYKRVRTNG